MAEPTAVRLVIEMVQARVTRLLSIEPVPNGYIRAMNEVVNLDVMLRELREADNVFERTQS